MKLPLHEARRPLAAVGLVCLLAACGQGAGGGATPVADTTTADAPAPPPPVDTQTADPGPLVEDIGPPPVCQVPDEICPPEHLVRPVACVKGAAAVADGDDPVGDHERRPTPNDHDRRSTPNDHDRRSTPNDHDRRSTPIEDDHEHETVGGDRVRGHSGFPQERLDAYRVALTMASPSKRVAADIPRGHRSVADHMLRAAANVVLLLYASEPARSRDLLDRRGVVASPRRADSARGAPVHWKELVERRGWMVGDSHEHVGGVLVGVDVACGASGDHGL